MKHYLIHFKNRLFDVVDGDGINLLPDELVVYAQDCRAGERVAEFAREAIVGYRDVSREDAARYRLFWADLQLERAAAEEGIEAPHPWVAAWDEPKGEEE